MDGYVVAGYGTTLLGLGGYSLWILRLGRRLARDTQGRDAQGRDAQGGNVK